MTDIHELNLVALRELLHSGELSAADVAEHYRARALSFNQELDAFSYIFEGPLPVANLAPGTGTSKALLAGVPTADKDLDSRIGTLTGYGSRTVSEQPSMKDDPITLAANAAGLVSIGKTAVPEFGLTGNSVNAVGSIAKNPWNTALGPGGSSSGAAVAVAAGLVPAALASDAGGSVRIPAASTGTVGFKPSRQLLPFNGLRELNRNTVHGPVARTVSDAALFLDALLLPESELSTAPLYQASVRPKPGKIAVSTWSPWSEVMDIGLDPEVSQNLSDTVAQLQAAGFEVEELPTPQFEGYGYAFLMLWQYTASQIVIDPEREELLLPFTQWLRTQGRSHPAKEREAAHKILHRFEKVVQDASAPYDAVLTPGLALLPQTLEWHDEAEPERNFEKQCQYAPYSSPISMAGLPAITLRSGWSSEGLPLTVQLVGKFRAEAELVSLAAAAEAVLDIPFSLPERYR